MSASRAAVGLILSRRSWVQLWLLRARPVAAKASTGRGTKAVYHKEGVDTHKCHAVRDATSRALNPVNAKQWTILRQCTALPHITASGFINDDKGGLHHDYELWLEELAAHAPVDQDWHTRTGEDSNAQRHPTAVL
jgi:thiamine phosphate synthase YjbQ (UPF0047 family)